MDRARHIRLWWQAFFLLGLTLGSSYPDANMAFKDNGDAHEHADGQQLYAELSMRELLQGIHSYAQ